MADRTIPDLLDEAYGPPRPPRSAWNHVDDALTSVFDPLATGMEAAGRWIGSLNRPLPALPASQLAKDPLQRISEGERVADVYGHEPTAADRFLADPRAQIMLGMIGPGGKALPRAAVPHTVVPPLAERPAGIRAYHGSPHDFDRFDMSRIGTGEGAQAYGHGLYFAENEGVAKSYRDNLTRPNFASTDSGVADLVAHTLRRTGNDIPKAVALLQERSTESPFSDPAMNLAHRQTVEKSIDYLGAMAPGRMYEVNIAARPEDFLDWDKPLNAQPSRVQDIVRPLYDAARNISPQQRQADERSPVHSMLRSIRNAGGNQEDVSVALRDAGIPGIRYLDQGSRGGAFKVDLATSRGPYKHDQPGFASLAEAEAYARAKEAEGFKTSIRDEGSRNYVVFDDRIIDILRKYGLMPIAGLGAASTIPDSESP